MTYFISNYINIQMLKLKKTADISVKMTRTLQS